MVADGHHVAVAANYGLEGTVSDWEGMTVYPKGLTRTPMKLSTRTGKNTAENSLKVNRLFSRCMTPGSLITLAGMTCRLFVGYQLITRQHLKR